MTRKPAGLVVLGSSLTGLAVARDAHRLGVQPFVVDRRHDVANASRLVASRVLPEADDETLCLMLEDLARSAAPCWLVASGDVWVRFIMTHRARLEAAFARILHPDNAALAVCLGKAEFAAFCEQHGLAVPPRVDAGDIRAGAPDVPYPLLLRPVASNHGRGAAVPKAVEAGNRDEALHWLGVYDEAGVEALVTASLLARPITQYSVGAARNGEALMSFVAVKRRPLPRVCAVGSYVELSPQPEVEALARRALEALDYQGIAEVEILRDDASGECFLIEINARPWVQYPLGPASGHPLLGYLIDPASFMPSRAATAGRAWLNLTQDLYFCLSRSVGHVRRGEISWRSWLASLAAARSFAYFAWGDPMPAWRNLRSFLRRG